MEVNDLCISLLLAIQVSTLRNDILTVSLSLDLERIPSSSDTDLMCVIDIMGSMYEGKKRTR